MLEDEDVAAMVGVHVQPAVERGVVSTGAGPVNAAFDTFQITVTGRGGHGAYPHLAVDPITTLATIIAALPEAEARVVNPIHPSVVSVGTIRGGTADNVISETATCTGTMRTFHEADRSALQGAMTRLAEGSPWPAGPRQVGHVPSGRPGAGQQRSRSSSGPTPPSPPWGSLSHQNRSAPAARTTSPSTAIRSLP
jgi:amidohydrolase